MVARVSDFLGGWRFAALLLPTLLFLTAAMALPLLVPPSAGPLASFAEDFKSWCFAADASGRVEWIAVFTRFTEPLLLAGIIWLLWGGSLRAELRRGLRIMVPYVAAALVLAALATLPLLFLLPGRAAAPEGFPAKDLRVALTPPPLALVDHLGRPVSLEPLRGRVVVITGIYSQCGLACPMILAQARRVVERIAAADVTVLAVTLDPEHDTVARLHELSVQRRLSSPTWRFVTGPPTRVHQALDALGFRRERDAKTGIIQHANLFLILDRGGRIAYRFTLGERQERWMEAGLRNLLAERESGS